MKSTIKAISAKTLIAASLVLSATAPAAAQGVAVYFGDLDIRSAAGAETLNNRLLNAVDRVCERPFIRNLKGIVAWNECKDAAMSSALEQLSAVYAARLNPTVTVE